MKIETIRAVLLRDDYQPHERWFFPGGGSSGWNAALLEIRTDEGLVGLGESIAGSTAPLAFLGMVKQLEPLLIGSDALDHHGLLRGIRRAAVYWGTSGIGAGVLSAIDIALWDIAAQARGIPLHALLGETVRREVPLYVSAGFQQSYDDLRDEMRRWKDSGFRAVKIRAFGTPAEIVRTVGVARLALGNEMTLMVDLAANFLPSPLSVQEALNVARGLKELNVEFLEEPMRSDEVRGYAALVHQSPVVIAGGESISSAEQFELLFDTNAFHLAQPDPTHCGGITAMLRIADSNQRGIRLAPHTWGSGVSLATSLHLVTAHPSYEISEFCGVTNRLQEALLIEPLSIVDGRVRAPAVAGLGVRLTDEIEDQYARPDARFAPTY